MCSTFLGDGLGATAVKEVTTAVKEVRKGGYNSRPDQRAERGCAAPISVTVVVVLPLRRIAVKEVRKGG